MNKKQLLEWVHSLPDDAEAMPFELSETRDECGDWERQFDLIGSTFPAVYQQQVRSEVTLRLRFTGVVQGEFQRDYFGNPQWANVRRVN